MRWPAVRVVEGVGEVDADGPGRNELPGQFGESLPDPQVGHGVRAGEQFKRDDVLREGRGDLSRAGVAADRFGDRAGPVKDSQGIGAAPGGRVQGHDGLVAVAELAAEPFPQDLVDEADLEVDHAGGRVVDPGLLPSLGVVGGEEVLVEPQPGLAAAVGAAGDLRRVDGGHEPFDRADLSGQRCPETADGQYRSERRGQYLVGGLKDLAGLGEGDQVVAIDVGAAAQRGDREAVRDHLGEVVRELLVGRVLVDVLRPRGLRLADRRDGCRRGEASTDPLAEHPGERGEFGRQLRGPGDHCRPGQGQQPHEVDERRRVPTGGRAVGERSRGVDELAAAVERGLLPVAHQQGVELGQQRPLLLLPADPQVSVQRVPRGFQLDPAARSIRQQPHEVRSDPGHLRLAEQPQGAEPVTDSQALQQVRHGHRQLSLRLRLDRRRVGGRDSSRVGLGQLSVRAHPRI